MPEVSTDEALASVIEQGWRRLRRRRLLLGSGGLLAAAMLAIAIVGVRGHRSGVHVVTSTPARTPATVPNAATSGSLSPTQPAQVIARTPQGSKTAEVSPAVAWPAPTPASFADGHTAAQALAQSLLDGVAAPPGSVVSTGPLPAPFDQPYLRPGTPFLVDLDRVWTVPGPPEAAASYVDSHLATGLVGRLTQTPTVGAGVAVTLVSANLSSAGAGVYSAGVLAETWAGSGNSSLLRVDAQVVWVPGRTPGEEVTSRDHTVMLRRLEVRPGFTTPTLGPEAVVTDATKVVALANAFNALPTASYVGGSCGPAVPGTTYEYQVAFEADPRASPDVAIDLTRCVSLTAVTVRGEPAQPLVFGGDFLATLQGLLGVSGPFVAPTG